LENIQFEISIQFKEKNNIYKKEITNKDRIQLTSHIFLFNFKPFDKMQNNYFPKNYIDEYPLSFFEQFKIYLNIIKEIYKSDRTSKECQDCVKYIINILQKIEFEFIFYISVLSECFDTSNISKLLKLFKTDQTLTKLGEFNNEDLAYFIDIINIITQKPNLVLDKVTGEEKSASKITLYAIILIFDLEFQKENLNLIYWNENLLCSIFTNYYHLIKFFDYKVIEEIISLTDDCFSIIFIINKTRNYLIDKFNEKKKLREKKGKKEKDLIIDLDNYVKFKEKEDKLEQIFTFIQSLIEFQKDKKIQFIYFSPHFFQAITELINERNFGLLFSLKEIVKSVKSFDTSLKYNKIDIDKILENYVYKTIINKNFSLLDDKSEYLINYLQRNDKYIDDCAIELIRNNERNEEFLKIRKEKKKKHNKDFINNACSVVTSLDQFDLLFEILCEGNENKEFLKDALISIMNTFLLIYKQYAKEQLMIYLDKISTLIYYFDLNLEEENVGIFLKELEKNLNKDFLVNLYVNILNKYQNLSIYIKVKFSNFCEKLESKYIVILIRDLNENSIDFIKQKILKYIVKEDEFFNLDTSISMKILTLLVSNGLFPRKDSSNIFLKETYNKIEYIKNCLINNEFTYKNISKFFKEENRQIFYDRISLLYLIDSKEMIINFYNKNKFFVYIQQSLENKYKEIKQYIDSLILYRDYLSNFAYYQNHIELVEIIKLIVYLENTKVNKIKKEEILKIQKYEKDFGQKAKERNIFSKSIIFMNIKEKEAKLYKNDEKIIIETFRKFKQTREIFYKDGFNSINQDIFSIYLKTFNIKKKDEIREELEIVKKLLNIKNRDNSTEKIVNILYLFSNKKDIIIKVTEALKIFINKTEVIKEYTKPLDNINEFKENTFNKDFLKISFEILEALGIDLLNENNYFVNILLSFRQKPEVINFLLSNSLEECEKLYDFLNNNNSLKISDIIDFEICVKFINSLGNVDKIKQMKDYELIEKATSSNLMNKNLVINLNNFIKNYDVIKEIMIDKLNSSKKINYILQNSKFCLSNIQKFYFEGKYEVKDEEKRDKTIDKDINLDELLELRDKALLKIESLSNTNKFIKFIHFVSDISKFI